MLGDEVAGHRGARHAGAAGDQHGPVGPCVGHGHDDLADVAGLAQVPQRRGRTPHVPRRDGQGQQGTLGEHAGQLDDVLAHPGPAGLEQVEGSVADPGMGGGDGVGVADVGLAHLEEHPAARQQPQRRIDELTGQRVQHHVEPPAAGGDQELLLEVQAARIADVIIVEPHGPQRVPLAPARRREHLETPVPGQLHRSHPDAAGAPRGSGWTDPAKPSRARAVRSTPW